MISLLRRVLPAILALLILPSLFAEDGAIGGDEAPDTENPILGSATNESAYKRGDGLFSLQLGTSLPLFIWNPNTNQAENPHLYPGGLLSIRYMGFVAPDFAIGGEIGASYSISVANRNFFMVPISFEAMWIGSKMPFEFPISLGLGLSIDKLSDYIHLDPFLKPQVGAFYRASPAWSFGILASYLWVPQFYEDASNTRFGNFMTVGLSVFNHL